MLKERFTQNNNQKTQRRREYIGGYATERSHREAELYRITASGAERGCMDTDGTWLLSGAPNQQRMCDPCGKAATGFACYSDGVFSVPNKVCIVRCR